MFSQKSRESRRQWGRLRIGRHLLVAIVGAVMCQGCILADWGRYPPAGRPRRKSAWTPSQENGSAGHTKADFGPPGETGSRAARVESGEPRIDVAQLAAAAEDEFVASEPPTVRRAQRSRWARTQSTRGELQSGGPRCGVIVVTGKAAKGLRAQNIDPVLTTWGWQFEYQYETSPEGPIGLVEFVPLLTGMEQGQAILSANVLFGLRTAKDWEFALGPNFGPASKQDTEPYPGMYPDEEPQQTLGIGLTVAVGKTFRAGPMKLPVNFAVVSNHDGVRYSLTFGWNMRQ